MCRREPHRALSRRRRSAIQRRCLKVLLTGTFERRHTRRGETKHTTRVVHLVPGVPQSDVGPWVRNPVESDLDVQCALQRPNGLSSPAHLTNCLPVKVIADPERAVLNDVPLSVETIDSVQALRQRIHPRRQIVVCRGPNSWPCLRRRPPQGPLAPDSQRGRTDSCQAPPHAAGGHLAEPVRGDGARGCRAGDTEGATEGVPSRDPAQGGIARGVHCQDAEPLYPVAPRRPRATTTGRSTLPSWYSRVLRSTDTRSERHHPPVAAASDPSHGPRARPTSCASKG
jgi:hypothetical protein